jgi:triphosphoribosyl-dephospho-CoA synthase
MHERLRAHDLVRLTPRAVARIELHAPAWIAQSLQRAPWVAVRRAHVTGGVAVGIRGAKREERFATVVQSEEIAERLTPEMLNDCRPVRHHGAFDALNVVLREARQRGLTIGPIGAAGFELATGVAALHEQSDLDVLVRSQPGDAALLFLARAIAALAVRVDVEVAFADDYGAALVEAVRGGDLLVKTPGGPRILPAFSPAQAAVQALRAEAELTPKPALVDRRGSGAHDDLTLDLLLRSAQSLGRAFAAVDAAARGAQPDAPLRERLGAIGREAEATMLRASGGINTHRGAIWSLGLLVAAHAMTESRDPIALAQTASTLARLPDAARGALVSHGARARTRYGVRGATGEAEAGFPHVVGVALPALRAGREAGASEAIARIDALLHIMCTLDDTCVLHRGGEPALHATQSGAAMALEAGGIGTERGMRAFEALESSLLAHRASPGGAADLLAATLFLDSIERGSWA